MHHLTIDEIKKIVLEIPNPRQRLMIKMAMSHGLRVSELINLKKENIRDGFVKVQRLKGSLKTIQPFVSHPDRDLSEKEDLEALYIILKPNERLFPMTRQGVYKLIQRAGTRAGIPHHKLHPHALKHSCAMLAIKKMGIQEVRQYLGHKSLNSTGEYLKETDESASNAFAKVFS